jgi:glycosyltransferase involved in cell wall biosynthesis
MSGPAIANGHAPRKPIRVCFVIDGLARAGTESQLLLMLKQCDRAVIEPYLCLLNGEDADSNELLPSNCQTLRLGIRRLASATALRQAWRFWRFLRQNQIDVVQTYFNDSTRFAAPIAKAAGIKTVFGSRRNIGHWMTLRDARIARFYNRFFIDKIIANSEAARQSAIEQEGIEPDRVVVIPNSIDLERFQHIAPWQSKPVGTPRKVGMVGNLRPVKGPDLFIRAAHLVLQDYPDTQFEIAGDGDQAPYQQLIDELGIANNVHLLGPVTDVPGFLATLDVAVLPSRAEGLSNALMEYMAAGRPIVATDVGGNGEVLSVIAEQCCVTEPEPSQLASRIRLLLNNSQIASRLANTAKELVLKEARLSRANDAYSSIP